MAKVQVDTKKRVENTEEPMYIRAGTGAGAVLGLVLAFTFWSHGPDMMHTIIAGIILVLCTVIGTVIGKVVASIGVTETE
jgi:ABC-type polysaccharide/polyol phosphate export permease